MSQVSEMSVVLHFRSRPQMALLNVFSVCWGMKSASISISVDLHNNAEEKSAQNPHVTCGETPSTHPRLPQEVARRALVVDEGADGMRVPPVANVLPCRRSLCRARRVASLRYLPAVAAAGHDLDGDIARSEVPFGAGDVNRDALHVDGALVPVCHGVLRLRLPETG